MIVHEIVITFLVVNLIITESRFQSSVSSKQLNKTIEFNSSNQENSRLPDSIKPENYKIILTPHFNDEFGEKFTFDGFVEIIFVIEKEVPAVIVHSKNLEFSHDHFFLQRHDDNLTIDTTIQYDPTSHFNYITPTSVNMTSGKYILSIKYKGILNENFKGFHRSPYRNKNGEEIWVAKTFFQPIFARQAFPCFDEPALKATFDLTIRHPFNYSAISNMPIKTSISIGSLQETTFETTPMMSTYLLATVVSDLKNIYKNKNFTVYTRPDRVKDGKLALEAGQRILEFFESYTGVPYVLPKMDQVDDLGQSKSMENWGLIISEEGMLLGDFGEKEAIKLVAHEFAHQWFGNLVTPKWWKFIWLSEGFSSFFCNYVTDQIYPQWRTTDWSMIKDKQDALFVDSVYANTYPLNRDVQSPAEIESIFNSFSGVVPYEKGSAIIHMMYHFLGQVIFKRGVNIYLIKNKYKAVDSSDLFQAFDEAMKEHKFDLGSNLQNVMNSWVNCKGYPVVTVTRNYNDPGLITIKQKRFETFRYHGKSIQEDCDWHVPISYATARNPQFNDTSFDFWLQEPSKNVSIKIESDEWLIINKQQTGFYRVNYDKKNWQLLINHLNSEKFNEIHVLNRAQILSDVRDFAMYDHLDIEIPIGLISYLNRERDYIAFNAGDRLVTWLLYSQIYTNHSLVIREKVLNVVRAILKPTDLDGSNEDSKSVDKQIKNHAIDWACFLNDTTCPVESKKK